MLPGDFCLRGQISADTFLRPKPYEPSLDCADKAGMIGPYSLWATLVKGCAYAATGEINNAAASGDSLLPICVCLRRQWFAALKFHVTAARGS